MSGHSRKIRHINLAKSMLYRLYAATVLTRVVRARRILKERPRFPSFISPPARSVILSLMEADITRRLGCMAGGVKDLHEHAW